MCLVLSQVRTQAQVREFVEGVLSDEGYAVKREIKGRVARVMVREVMMPERDEQRLAWYTQVVRENIQEDRLSTEVKHIMVTLIVEQVKERRDMEDENVQGSRNAIELFVEVLKLHHKQDIYTD